MGGTVGMLSQLKQISVIETIAFSWSPLPPENSNEISNFWYLVITVLLTIPSTRVDTLSEHRLKVRCLALC